jgi:hypothetical protein
MIPSSLIPILKEKGLITEGMIMIFRSRIGLLLKYFREISE